MTPAAFGVLLLREGGYVNNPADRGGPTKYGVTLKTLRAWRDDKALRLTADDVKALTVSEAADIYEHAYWRAAQCDNLAPPLNEIVFDAAVNHGVKQAMRFLQRAVGAKADGVWGVATAAAVALYATTPNEPAADVLRQRAEFFRALVRKDASQQQFLKGWLARLRNNAREAGLPIDPSYAGAE